MEQGEKTRLTIQSIDGISYIVLDDFGGYTRTLSRDVFEHITSVTEKEQSLYFRLKKKYADLEEKVLPVKNYEVFILNGFKERESVGFSEGRTIEEAFLDIRKKNSVLRMLANQSMLVNGVPIDFVEVLKNED